ncbi:glycosyltransferase family 2 protein [Piscinibacter sp. XHJ-5]|uniref:glycosyltransferase family 2 protein n=1 Tax=Piscinibacter sp. XHJ-5 TaxID=3037797 RepID=UPI0024530B16|nr:glycosyltransferase family 2 protein [Piscinibacter sp. XHJ-5]
MNTPDLTIVIVSYNTAQLLAPLFESVQAAAGGLSLQIVVVDNASSDGSAALIRERYPHVELIANETNVGFGRANNQAIPLIRGAHVLLLNTDAFMAPDTLAKTLSYMKAHPDCGVLGVRLVGRDGGQQASCRRFPTPLNAFLLRTGLARFAPWVRGIDDPRWNPALSQDCDWVPGCYYLMPRAVVERVGLFDPRFFLYSEEVDHCKRVRQAGWRVHYYADTTVVHLGGESAKVVGEVTESGRQISALQIESELLFFRKHHGALGVWAALALTAFADAYLALKWVVKRRDIAGTRAYWKHVNTTWSLFRHTQWATCPTR